jgi:uncharacterized membrane protein YfcA
LPPPRSGAGARRRGASPAAETASGLAAIVIAAALAAALLIARPSVMLVLLMALGAIGAFIAGLVGIGGAIVMIPLLLYVPPLFGRPALGIHEASGISMVQVAAAAVTGMLAHRRAGAVDGPLTAYLGGSMLVASLLGGILSDRVSAPLLNILFATLAAAGAALMLGGRRGATAAGADAVSFSRAVAVLVGIATGLLVGMVGAGGGFLLVPLMIYALHVPVRIAVGTSLAIVALSGIGGMVGKAVTGQIVWGYALALVAGALPAAQLGARASRRVPAAALARMLGGLIALIALKMWWDVLG